MRLDPTELTKVAGDIQRRLGQLDRIALSAFRCRRLLEPWSDEVEEMIRAGLADSLAAGIVEAEGVFVGVDLAAVIAWRPERDPAVKARHGDRVWQSTVLAVSVDHRGERLASKLKRWLLNEAHSNGVRYLTSLVHWDNHRMIEMNRRLGGSMVRVTTGPFTFDDQFGRCIVPVKQWPIE